MDNIRASRDRLNIQIRHSDLPLALCEQRSNILVNVNEIVTKTAFENLKYMNIYNSLLRKNLCLPPSDPKMHCEPRGKLEMSTYPLVLLPLFDFFLPLPFCFDFTGAELYLAVSLSSLFSKSITGILVG